MYIDNAVEYVLNRMVSNLRQYYAKVHPNYKKYGNAIVLPNIIKGKYYSVNVSDITRVRGFI